MAEDLLIDEKTEKVRIALSEAFENLRIIITNIRTTEDVQILLADCMYHIQLADIKINSAHHRNDKRS